MIVIKMTRKWFVLILGFLTLAVVFNRLQSEMSQLEFIQRNREDDNKNIIAAALTTTTRTGVGGTRGRISSANDTRNAPTTPTETTMRINTNNQTGITEQEKLQQKTVDIGDSVINHNHTTASCGVSRYPGSSNSIPYGLKQPPKVELTGDKYHLTEKFLVIPEYKLLFCYIEKVSCTMFQQLFRMLRLYHPTLTNQERQFVAQEMYHRFRPSEHFHMSTKDLNELMMNPNLTKALFVRDPATRFLSAFKSKCTSPKAGGDRDAKKTCREAFGNGIYQNGGPTIANFQKAIELAENNTDKVFSNRHFRAANVFCGGLSQSLDYYDFIHLLDRSSVDDNVRRLLLHIGVETNLTNRLVTNVVKTGGRFQKEDVDAIQHMYNIKTKRTGPSEGHDSSNRNTISNQDFFQTPELLQRLQNVYKDDYELFQLQPISFEEL